MVIKVKKSYLMQAVKKALKQDVLPGATPENEVPRERPAEAGQQVSISKDSLSRIVGTMYGAGWTVEQIAETVKMPVQWVEKAAETKYWDKMAKKVHFMPHHKIESELANDKTGEKETEMKTESKKRKTYVALRSSDNKLVDDPKWVKELEKVNKKK